MTPRRIRAATSTRREPCGRATRWRSLLRQAADSSSASRGRSGPGVRLWWSTERARRLNGENAMTQRSVRRARSFVAFFGGMHGKTESCRAWRVRGTLSSWRRLTSAMIRPCGRQGFPMRAWRRILATRAWRRSPNVSCWHFNVQSPPLFSTFMLQARYAENPTKSATVLTGCVRIWYYCQMNDAKRKNKPSFRVIGPF